MFWELLTDLVNKCGERKLGDWCVGDLVDLLGAGNENMIFVQGGNGKRFSVSLCYMSAHSGLAIMLWASTHTLIYPS